jgi:MICOS complex subunit MIC19
MGASHSKQDTEQVFYNPVPIQVSPIPNSPSTPCTVNPHHTTPHTKVSSELATQLSDTSLSPEVSQTRHAILDQSVRAKISAEAARLRGRNANDNDNDDHHGEGVDIVQREIEAALERENLDRERGMAGDAVAADADAAHGDVKNSTVLLGDLEEVRQKVDRYRVRASLADHLGVKEAREAVASCYQYVFLNFWSFIRSFFQKNFKPTQSESDDDS